MYFYLIGIDYRSSPIDARDEIYRGQKVISDFWALRDPHGAVVLATCNRIEIYGAAGYADDALGHIRRFTELFPDFVKYAYLKYGEAEVFRHALRLASGLESQIKGEPQILEQLSLWLDSGRLPHQIKDLWNRAISLSKKIRAASKLNEETGNIATIVFDDIKKRLDRKERYEIIIIGTGKIAEVFAKYRPSVAHLTFVAHKNHQKAKALSEYSDGDAVTLKDLPHIIAKADALIGATASPHYILKKEHFDKYPVSREDPLYVYDLAMPRGVEPAVRGISGAYLYNLDMLEDLFSKYNESLRHRIELASGMIEDTLANNKETIYDKNR